MMSTMRTVGTKSEIEVDLQWRLGIGRYSKVFSGRFKNRTVAVKRVEKQDGLRGHNIQDVSHELKLLRNFDHQNIISYLYDDFDQEYWYIVFTKCQYTLSEVIEGSCDVPYEPYKFLHHITDGLQYLHNVKNLVHRDLKPSNILLTSHGGKWAVKIADFGISKLLPEDATSCSLTSEKGTRGYMAPELLKGERLGKESDIFSLGIVFFYVLSGGMHPFGENWAEIHANIYHGAKPQFASLGEDYAFDTKTLIASMLVHDYEERLDIQQVQAHHIFWDDGRKLTFFQEVSDCLEARKKHAELIRSLEKGVNEDSGKNWRKKLLHGRAEDSAIFSTLTNRRNKNKKSIQDLIRMIRNWKHHYHDEGTSAKLRKELSPLPGGLLQIFTSNFPSLLPRVYDLMKKCREENLKKFYRTDSRDDGIRDESAFSTGASGGSVKVIPAIAMPEVNDEDSSPKADIVIKDLWKKVGKRRMIVIGEPIFQRRGANSVVYHGWYEGKNVAVKMMMNANDHLSKEVKALQELMHENIVRYWFKDKGEIDQILYIVLEKCDYTLQQHVDKNRPEIDIKPYQVLRQTTKGLCYLHKKDFVHRDLKPSNILLVKRGDHWLVKISDFGISIQLSRDKTSTNVTSISGTDGYIAPEIIKKKKVSKKSDIFSLGIVFHYVLSGGDHPFADSTTAIVNNICDKKFKPSLDNIKQDYACETKKLIESMIEHDVAKRVDVRQVKSHHIFWKDVKRMIFIMRVSDFLRNQEKHQHVINELEKNVDEQMGENWRDRLMSLPDSTAIRENLQEKTAETHGKNIYYLLRVIRNWESHLNDRKTPEKFKQEITREFGPGLEGILKLFPKFLSRVYDVMWSQRSAYEMHTYFGIKPELHKSSKAQSLNDMEVPAGSGAEAVEVDSTQQKEEAVVNTGSQKHTHDGKQCVSRKITLYEYQKELAKQALDGDNSMIIAPTGSGKTAVAFAIIEKRLTQHKDKHILFFVSKCILARQQYHFLKSQLPEYSVGFITGRDAANMDAGLYMHEKDVTVLTPQILTKELIKHPPGISFAEISLMVFDECHHATGNHPYKIIMDMFLDSKRASSKTQIVGMTASPGVGKGSGQVKVLSNLLALLAGLNITQCPVTVTENLDELRQHLCKAKETCFPVESTQDEFMHKLMEAMAILENFVTKHVTGLSSAKGIDHPPKEKEKQVYEQWTRELHKYAELNMDEEKSYLVKQLAQHLNTYYDWLTLKNIIPNVIRSTMMAHEDRNLVFDDTDLGKMNQELMKLSETCKIPMLETLVEILKTEFTRKPDGRCIIFVERKLTACCLAECIRDEEELAKLEPEYLFSGRECYYSGMRAQHMRLLDAFKDGNCKLLISTSIAVEGLDIAECNLVISYDYVTGEVGRIQRAGRGRATGSKFVLIASVGGGKLEREKDNEIYSKASENAIADIREEADDKLREKILNIQKEKICKRAWKKANEQSAPKDDAFKWKVICPGSEGSIITVGVRLRYLIQGTNEHTVVKDPDFESHVDKKACALAKGPVQGNAEYFCKSCGEKVALNMKLPNQDRVYIALCTKRVIFQNAKGEKMSLGKGKKRKKIPFQVQVWEESDEEPMELEEVSVGPVQDVTSLEDERLDENELREVKALVDAELS